jgi:branched-chain amino acid aminotransferase
MTRFYLFDGRPLSADSPVLTAQARPLRYGDGFFESYRMDGPKVLFAQRHIARLKDTGAFMAMDAGPGFDLEKESTTLWEMAGRPVAARVRLQFWHSSGLTYLPEGTDCHRLMELVPLDQRMYPGTVDQFRIGVFADQAVNAAPLGNHKTSSCLPSVLGARWAKENGYDDVLMLDAAGHVAEANAANIFFVVDDGLLTPDLGRGGLRGVMRNVVMDLAKEHGIALRVAEVTLEDAERATEMFITSSVRGIMPGTSFLTKPLQRTMSDSLLALLNCKAFS